MMGVVASRDPFKETLTPAPDGIVQQFYTSQAYKPGSVAVWQNGIKVIGDWDDGFTETGASEITMNEAPLTGDSVQAEYEPL